MRNPISGLGATALVGACEPSARRRPGNRSALATVLTALVAHMAFASTGAAQGYVQPSGLGGFMQGLLGGGPSHSAPPTHPQASPNPMPLAPWPQVAGRAFGPNFNATLSLPQSRPAQGSMPHEPGESRKSSRSGASNAAASLGGGLRTMCVRLCDGYYWPLTFDARRSRLDHDAKVCSASCASEARVFVMPKSGEARDMVDAQGRPYVKLVNAFKYRKIAAGSCSCRPDPWDDEARARHDRLAAAAIETAPAATGKPLTSSDVSSSTPSAAPSSGPSAGEVAPATSSIAPMTLADVQSLSLVGGLVSPSSGAPSSDKLAAQPEGGRPAAAPSAGSVAVADAKVAPAAATAVKSSKTAEAKRSEARGRQSGAARARHAADQHRPAPMLIATGRYPIPQRYPAQPYLISPGPGAYIRTY